MYGVLGWEGEASEFSNVVFQRHARQQPLEELYEKTAWKLEAESGAGSSYDRFKLAIT